MVYKSTSYHCQPYEMKLCTIIFREIKVYLRSPLGEEDKKVGTRNNNTRIDLSNLPSLWIGPTSKSAYWCSCPTRSNGHTILLTRINRFWLTALAFYIHYVWKKLKVTGLIWRKFTCRRDFLRKAIYGYPITIKNWPCPRGRLLFINVGNYVWLQ